MFDPTKECPLYHEPCHQHACALYVQLRGADPQTGAPVGEFGCAIYWAVIVTLEGNKESRAVAGEVEALRKEMAESRDTLLALADAGAVQIRRVNDARDNHRR